MQVLAHFNRTSDLIRDDDAHFLIVESVSLLLSMSSDRYADWEPVLTPGPMYTLRWIRNIIIVRIVRILIVHTLMALLV